MPCSPGLLPFSRVRRGPRGQALRLEAWRSVGRQRHRPARRRLRQVSVEGRRAVGVPAWEGRGLGRDMGRGLEQAPAALLNVESYPGPCSAQGLPCLAPA